jgi:PAS domain S-box-containing protein
MIRLITNCLQVSGLSEVFCLTDPKQEDNPIIYASEGFYQMTGYTRDFVIGTNCRFLQGPKTQHHSVRRLQQAVGSGQELSEALLNYRRDGRPFMNILMIAPLHDNKGNVKYHIGAQIDASGLIEGGKGLDAFERYLSNQQAKSNYRGRSAEKQPRPPQGSQTLSSKEAKKKTLEKLGELSDMFDLEENAIVAQRSRSNSRDRRSEDTESTGSSRSRRVFAESSESEPDEEAGSEKEKAAWSLSQTRSSGKLPGVYESYFLMRPSPSLKIIFASPALRKMGNLVQSTFLSHVTAPPATLKGLKESFEAGNPVTAKVTFSAQVSKPKDGRQLDRGQGKKDIEETSSSKMGRTFWISATPLLGGDDEVGVWMVVLVDQRSLGSDTSYMRSHGKSQPATPSIASADRPSEVTNRVGPGSPSMSTSKTTRPSHINLPDRMGIRQGETRQANSVSNLNAEKDTPEPRKSSVMPQRAKGGRDVMEQRDERLDHKQHLSSPSPTTPKRNGEYIEEPNEFVRKYEPQGMFVKPNRVHIQPDNDDEDEGFTLGTEQEVGNDWDHPMLKDGQQKVQVAKGSVPGDEADANTEKESNIIPRTESEKIVDGGVEDGLARSQPRHAALEQAPEKGSGSDTGSHSAPEKFLEPTSNWRSELSSQLALEPLTEQALKTHNAEWSAETRAIAPVEVPHALPGDEMNMSPSNQVRNDPGSDPDPPVLTEAGLEEGEFKLTNVKHNDGPEPEHDENDDNTITAPDRHDSTHEADEPAQSQTDLAGTETAGSYMDYLLHPGSRPGSRRAITATNLHSQGRTMGDLEVDYWERHEDPDCDTRTPFSVD